MMDRKIKTTSSRRFLWHSGLLLLLFPIVSAAPSSSGILSPSGERIENGALWVPPHSSASLKCQGEDPEWSVKGEFFQKGPRLLLPTEQEEIKVECYSPSATGVSYSFLYVSSGPPSDPPALAEFPPPSISLKYGQDTTLKCSVIADSLNPLRISWLRNGRVLVNNSGSLDLKNVTISGTYGCLVSSFKSARDFAYKETQILVPPKITSPLEEDVVYVLAGSSLRRECISNVHNASWIQVLPEKESISSKELFLDNIRKNSKWKCVASNVLGVDEKNLRISVVSPTVVPEPSETTILQGQSVGIDCEAEVDDEITSKAVFAWYHNGTLLPEEISSVFLIQNADYDSSGNYSCVVNTPVDFGSTYTVARIVSSPIITSSFSDILRVLSGRPFNPLECLASGDPMPDIFWSVIEGEEESLISKSATLSLDDSSVINDNIFTCKAENPYGSVEKSFTLKVYEPTRVANNGSITKGLAGGSATLLCNTTLDPGLVPVSSVNWYKDGQILEHFISPEKNVVIPYLRREHAGSYLCRTNTPLEKIVSVSILEVAVEPPRAILPFDKVNVTLGSSVNINCNASGIPTPGIHWKSEDEKRISDSPLLKLSQVRENDRGYYTCMAVNEYGSHKKTLFLEVFNKTVISFLKDTLISKSSEVVDLDCPVQLDRRIKIKSITWLKNKEVLSTKRNLILQNITKVNEGFYTCIVTTSVDSANRTLRLTVLSEGPSFLSTEKDVRTLEGSNITVACQANGLPIPKISWYKNNNPILKDDGHRSVGPLGDLSILDVRYSDQGNYTCTASNIYGEISTNSTIQVIRRSKMASDFKKVNNVIKNVREDVVLDCDVVYDPRLDQETQLEWKKDDVSIRIDRGKYISAENSLKIYNLDLNDQGTYECVVKTPFESISYKTALIVSGEPPKIISDFKKISLYEGEDLRLQCLVRGVPRPTLVWHFQDAPLTNAYVHEIATASKLFRESRVIVKNVTKSNDGVYQCRADNEYGSGVAKFSRVNVIRRTRVVIAESGEISVQAGTNLKIPCSLTKDESNQITNIQWIKPFEVGAKDRVDFGIDGSISIRDIQKRHSGVYKCLVSTIMDNANDSVLVTVNVNAPFITSFTGEKQVIFQGESLSLFCNANGIPKPVISWNFNKTKTKVSNNSEFKILNAISSDSGKYECVARNQYGETRKTMMIRVILTPILEEDVPVADGKSVELSCVIPDKNVRIKWVGPDGKQIADYNHQTGRLLIPQMTQNNFGRYSCSISIGNGRSRTLIKNLHIKPEIIMAKNNTFVDITEGKNLTLECNVLPGIGAKRLWKHNSDIIIPGGNREVSNRGSLLTIENIRKDVDSGSYVCMAIADFGKDTIEYIVQVKALPVSKKEITCTESRLNSISVPDVFRVNNDTVLVRWDLPTRFNSSCYEGVFMNWWTNEREGEFAEEAFPFSKSEATISSLNPSNVYYVQINLKEISATPSKKVIYGQTTSFSLENLTHVDDEYFKSSSESSSSSSAFNLESPSSILILVSVLLILLLLASVLVLLYYKNKFACCEIPSKNAKKRKTLAAPDYRDFQLIQSPARGIDDFMQNIAPQWPEPEPPTSIKSDEDDETQTFIKQQVPTPHHHHHASGRPIGQSRNNSISSSWSSLFNLPIDAKPSSSSNNKSKFGGFVT